MRGCVWCPVPGGNYGKFGFGIGNPYAMRCTVGASLVIQSRAGCLVGELLVVMMMIDAPQRRKLELDQARQSEVR